MGVFKNWSRKCHTSTTNCVSFGQGQVYIYIAYWHIVTVFHLLLITLKLKVDDLDFEDGNVDNEKSDEEKKSDMEYDHNIEENKNELNEQCEYKALASDENVISVSLQ